MDGKYLVLGGLDESGKGVNLLCELPACSTQKVIGQRRESVVYAITPDGLNYAFLKPSDPANIWIRPIAGGEAKPLTHFSDRKISNFAWSPDGKHLAISRYVEQSDIVRIRGFQP